jgi:hypothetical protein
MQRRTGQQGTPVDAVDVETVAGHATYLREPLPVGLGVCNALSFAGAAGRPR